MPLRSNEVLVIKSGGNIVVDGVLLKKPRVSLFLGVDVASLLAIIALNMDSYGRIGWRRAPAGVLLCGIVHILGVVK